MPNLVLKPVCDVVPLNPRFSVIILNRCVLTGNQGTSPADSMFYGENFTFGIDNYGVIGLTIVWESSVTRCGNFGIVIRGLGLSDRRV